MNNTVEDPPSVSGSTLRRRQKQEDPIGEEVNEEPKLGALKNVMRYTTESYGLRGPIGLMVFGEVMLFMFVTASAQLLGWSPNIRIYQLVVYVNVAHGLFVSSKILAKDERGIVRFYMTIIPFVLLLAFSRESHVFIGSLFYCTTLIVLLQSGLPNLRIHMMIFIWLVISAYSLTVIFMMWFYRDTTGVNSFFGRALSPQVNWKEEVAVIISFGILGVGFLLLGEYVKVHAITLFERTKKVKRLESRQQALLDEIEKRQQQQQAEVNLDSPLMIVLKDIQAMSGQLGEQMQHQLEQVIGILTSNNIYEPTFQSKRHKDQEFTQLLSNIVAEKPNTSDLMDFTSQRRHTQIAREAGVGTARSGTPTVNTSFIGDTLLRGLETLDSWEFNALEFAGSTQGRPLFHMAKHMMRRHSLLSYFKLDPIKFEKWAEKIEAGHGQLPYHNSLHAADTLQAIHCILLNGGLAPSLNKLDILACFMAGMMFCHAHPGRSNEFQINTQSDIAICYNDRSVVQNNSCATSFLILAEDECNFIADLPESQHRELREMIIAMVLATDTTTHFEIVGKLNAKLVGSGINMADKKDRLLILQAVVKMAGLSQAARGEALFKQWSDLFLEEMWLQAEEEKRLGLPSPSFLSKKHPSPGTMARLELGFIKFLTRPLFQSMATQLPNLAKPLAMIDQIQGDLVKQVKLSGEQEL